TNLLLADETKLGGPAGASAIVLAVWVVGFFVYDQLWKALEKKETAGVIVSFVLLAGMAFGLGQILVGRAMFIAIGGLLGTIMAANVWMRIWPAQRKIISATKAGTAPDAAIAARSTLRSKHNTYMSIPLVFTMISNHFPSVLGNDWNWLILMVLVVAGWAVTKLIYKKSATAA